MLKNQKPSANALIGTAMVMAGVGAATGFAFVSNDQFISSVVEVAQQEKAVEKTNFTVKDGVVHLETPEPMYAIYMSQCVVGTPSFRDSLISLIDSTSLNAVVIDIKDFSGTIGFRTEDPRFEDASLVSCGAGDMQTFLKTLHEKGIYAIGRITVFQDPFYTDVFPDQAVQSIARPGEPWEDHKGLSFVDVSSKDFWKYIVELSKEAYAIGFDELNYDYIRYPSDGNMKDAQYVNDNKAEAIENFFKYLHSEVSPIGVKMSADLFGYTTVLPDDLGIGQQLERTLPYFDYVAPMVYPSHYNKGFVGLSNPNNDPYKVVNYSMSMAATRAESDETAVKTLDGSLIFKNELVPSYFNDFGEFVATTTKKVSTGYYTKEVHDKLKLRPWLQDFDYGKEYTPEDIEAQIKATYDSGLTSWFFWDPANKYDSLKQYLISQ